MARPFVATLPIEAGARQAIGFGSAERLARSFCDNDRDLGARRMIHALSDRTVDCDGMFPHELSY